MNQTNTFDLLIRKLYIIFLPGHFLVSELRKTYGHLTAVNRISVGIQRNQCFGLLGINGAGKTSTFKMLTGDEMVSGGNAYLDGYSVRSDLTTVNL